MADSLSEKLNFKVNKYPVVLGQTLDINGLKAHRITKGGFFVRLLLRPEKGELLYLSKNSTLSCLSEDSLSVKPLTDPNKKRKSLFDTISYFWFKNGRLSNFGFQIIREGAFNTGAFFEALEKKITSSLCSPTDSSKTHKVWNDSEQKLILALPVNNRYGYIHLMLND